MILLTLRCPLDQSLKLYYQPKVTSITRLLIKGDVSRHDRLDLVVEADK